MAEEAAGKLGIWVKTLIKHDAGSIRFINIGTKKRRQLRFTQSNIDTLIQAKKHKEVPHVRLQRPSKPILAVRASAQREAVSRYYFRCRHQNQKATEAVEASIRAKVLQDLEQQKLTGSAPLTFAQAASRFWHEVGQHHVNASTTRQQLMRLVEFFTEKKRLDDITDADIAALVSWRKGQGVSNATVNRTALIPLKTIFNRAKRAWKQTLPKEPYWRSHMLKEPQERVRE